MRAVATCLALAGCTGGLDGDDGLADAATGCFTVIDFSPEPAYANSVMPVRADAMVHNAPGVVDYSWVVTFQGVPVATQFASSTHASITFPIPTPGIYKVRLSVQAPVFCPDHLIDLNVLAPNANMAQVRLHVTPPASAATPPLDALQLVNGGASSSLGNLVLPPGIEVTQMLGMGAYLRFMPLAGREAAVEAFADPVTGMFTARLRNEPHDVLVVPISPQIAPAMIREWQAGSPLVLPAGEMVRGTVHGPGGGGLGGAKVQLAIGGAPSTLATTAADGTFSLLAVPVVNAAVTVDVTPLAGSGLPRLSATSMRFDLAQEIQVDYAALALRDVGGAVIRRAGNPLANARLALVGGLGAAGTVTAGVAAAATGSVRIAATANGAGVLPPTLAPATLLAGVVEPSPQSYAVANVDLTTGVPSTIDAPAPVGSQTRIDRPGGVAIAGAYLELVPVGALAMAGATSVRLVSGASGALAMTLASGGHYELRFADPQARGAALVVSDVTAATLAARYALRAGVALVGKLMKPSSAPIGNASVQILCAACTGIDRDRPLAETVSGAGGDFTVVVVDPGTMIAPRGPP